MGCARWRHAAGAKLGSASTSAAEFMGPASSDTTAIYTGESKRRR
ncbi:MAG: hypothetical protein NVV63_12465 [Opitutus sp.]|nr:hypothetical protein [Opitutus sp.]